MCRVTHRLLCAGSHVRGHPGSAASAGGTQLTAAYLQAQRHLIDDSILESSPCASSQNSLHAASTAADSLSYFPSFFLLTSAVAVMCTNWSSLVHSCVCVLTRDVSPGLNNN